MGMQWLLGAIFFLHEMTAFEKDGKKRNGRVAPPESVPIYLKTNFLLILQTNML